MVFIRTKIVNGLYYSYLVSSIWNKETKASKQKTIKYLGSTFTINDIPLEYRTEPSIEKYFNISNTDNISKKSYIQKIHNCKECNREVASKKILTCLWCNRKKKMQIELGILKI
tara:strand:+ start:271 stop:612 length:342 start_codon:yes stop_codon:yes gene_type:complete